MANDHMSRWLHPKRDGKIPIKYSDYPAGYLFPPWCHGGGVGMSKKSALAILETRALADHNEFYIDDLLFYGIYRELAGIKEFYSHKIGKTLLKDTCTHMTSIDEYSKRRELESIFSERMQDRKRIIYMNTLKENGIVAA